MMVGVFSGEEVAGAETDGAELKDHGELVG